LTFDITIDGKWMIPEYDPERHICTTQPHWRLTPGPHTLKIDIHDRCDNHTVVTSKFRIRAAGL
jgi:hypothetical protein